MTPTVGIVQYDRDGIVSPDSPYEKIVILPEPNQTDPCIHAWCDARFATEILTEHALFFTLMMPPETCATERNQAQQFYAKCSDLFKKIEANGVPKPDALKAFCQTVIESFKPFIEWKVKMRDAQTSGALRSLVWPSYFDHTYEEGARWVTRLTQLAGGQSEYERQEVIRFNSEIVSEHAGFNAHLLDPEEQAMIERCVRNSRDFQAIHTMCVGPNGCPLASGGTDSVLVAAQGALAFDVAASRAVEAPTVKSIIDPRLADHIRRETLKFVDELQRSV